MSETKHSDLITLDFNGAVSFAVASLRANRTPLLLGQPGVGKTATAPHIVRRLGLDGYVVATPTMHSAMDLRGLGYLADIYDQNGKFVGKETRFGKSTILPNDGKWLIFIDELPDCPRWEQSAFYQLLHSKKIGEWTAPEGSHVMAAGNGVEHRAAANELSSAIKGRVAIAKVVPSAESILKHAIEDRWNPLVISFIKLYPTCIFGFNPADFACGCTPRDLDALSRLENNGWEDDGNQAVGQALVAGNIGAEWYQKYWAHRSIQIPDPDLVLKNPMEAPVPREKPVMYAFLSALAFRATQETFPIISAYAGRLDGIYATSLIIDCLHANSDIARTKEYMTWFRANMGVI